MSYWEDKKQKEQMENRNMFKRGEIHVLAPVLILTHSHMYIFSKVAVYTQFIQKFKEKDQIERSRKE